MDQDPVRVSTHTITLNQVAAAGADETNAEIVVRANGRARGCANGGRTHGTIPTELIHPNVIVIAVGNAVATARSRTRIDGVSDRDDPFDDAVRHTIHKHPAEAVVVRSDLLHYGSGADSSRTDVRVVEAEMIERSVIISSDSSSCDSRSPDP